MTTKDRGAHGRFLPGNPHRFAKGVSGNPGGRPKEISNAYRAWLARRCRNRRQLRLYAKITGGRIDKRRLPTNAEVIAARNVHSAITAEDGLRFAREIREATEVLRPAPLEILARGLVPSPPAGAVAAEEKRGAGASADTPTT